MPTSVDRERRLFTIEDANRTLPLVSRVVRDIVEVDDRIRSLDQAARAQLDSGDSSAAIRLQDELQAAIVEQREFARELQLVGLELRDARRGVVDFPAERDGRPMLLTWELGEERVDRWREFDRPVSTNRPRTR